MADTSIAKTELQVAILEDSLQTKISNLNFDTLSETGTLLADLHNEGSQDIIAYFETLAWDKLSDRDRRRAARVLEAFAASVQDSSERITPFFHAMHCRASKVHVDNGFQAWIAANRSQISEVATLIKDREQDSPFLGSLLYAWREVAPVDALNAAIVFSQDKRPAIKRQAIFALGVFKYADDKEAALAEKRLADLLSSDSVEEQCTAISAIARMIEKQDKKSARLVAELEKAADQPNAEIRHQLIAGLIHHRDVYPPPLRDKVFSLMKTVQSDCGETLNLIDLALYNMDIDTDRDTVFETLTAILSQKTGAPSLKTFDSLVHKIETTAHEVIGWYATHWLLDGQYEICNQLNSLFPPLDKSVYNFRLDAFGLSDAEVIYLAHKIYVYLMFSHGPAISLLCACLMSLKLKERKLLEEDIASFWLHNYPSDLNLFDAACKAHPCKGLKASIERMRRQVDAYEKPLRSLPSNPALLPSTMDRRIQAEIAHERSKEISRIAGESSPLASLFHKSTLLYGRSSVTYIYPSGSDEPVRQVIPLQSYQTSSELPRMDILYPARLNYLFYRFRRESWPE
jgi:hypothetical protein